MRYRVHLRARSPVTDPCTRVSRQSGRRPCWKWRHGRSAGCVRASSGSAAAELRSLERVLLQHALGHDVSRESRETEAAAVMMIPIPWRGVYRGVSGEDAARLVPFVEEVQITAKPGQLLEPLPEAGSYLGFIFARAPRPAQVEAAVREAHRRLAFAVVPPIDVRAG